MNTEPCETCGGSGRVFWEEPHYEYVTKDMATDAGEPQLVGQQIQWGTDQCEGVCPDCNGERSQPDAKA